MRRRSRFKSRGRGRVRRGSVRRRSRRMSRFTAMRQRVGIRR